MDFGGVSGEFAALVVILKALLHLLVILRRHVETLFSFWPRWRKVAL